MSQEALQELLDRAANDEEFAACLREDPVKTLSHLEISSTELFTLTCADEDGLRRLLGATEDAEKVDLSLFAKAATPVFDEKVAAEVEQDAAAGGKTTKVTSATVTTCCYP